MKKILGIGIVLAFVAVMMLGTLGSGALFFDKETTNNNAIAAGTLDMTIDGVNTNVIKFDVANAQPGYQPTGSWILKNEGTLGGKLTINDISVTQTGGVLTEPEAAAGDTNNAGNLGDLVNIRLYVDNPPITGYYGNEDTMFYNGPISGLNAAAFNALNLSLAPGASVRINAVIDWWSHDGDIDNSGQGDTANFGIGFLLTQNH
jgi:hypothetical protein